MRESGAAVVATFNYKVVRQFAVMTVVWGIVGMLVGVIIAAQLLWPDLTYGIAWLSYGRLRPLHTNAVIFAFGGSALFATSYLRRPAHLPGAVVRRHAGGFHVLGMASGHRARGVTLPLGITTARSTPSSNGRSTS
jgi:cytochrome c oxidase cbb3-type subunit 1